MKLLVTGAGGFLGAQVLRAALARGHAPRGLWRHAPVTDLTDVIVADLAQGLPDSALDGIDAVIHCAARLTGDASAMARDTVAATARLAGQAARMGVPMVLAGSIAVYDGMAGPVVTEDTPLERRSDLRDAYTRAKLEQERVAMAAGGDLRILRIGALWGRGVLWHAHLGQRTGPVLWRLGQGELPLCHVDHAAEALVIALEQRWHGVDAINVVDDDRPDAVAYLSRLPNAPPYVLRLPFGMIDGAARLLSPCARHLPGLLRRPTLHARMAPRRYDNARLHALGWRPKFTFAEGMAEHA